MSTGFYTRNIIMVFRKSSSELAPNLKKQIRGVEILPQRGAEDFSQRYTEVFSVKFNYLSVRSFLEIKRR
jgi:hypothetical protein